MIKRAIIFNAFTTALAISASAHALQPSDELFNSQWAMNNSSDTDVNAPQGWDYFSPTNQEVVIALLDTGIDTTHIDLKTKLWKNQDEFTGPNGTCVPDNIDNDGNGYVDDCYGWNAREERGITDLVYDDNNNLEPAMNDPVGHGTQMAGIALGAANGTGIVGVAGIAPNVKIVTCAAWTAQPVNELTSIPLTSYALSGLPEDQVECANYFSTLKDQGVNIVVVNISGGVSALSKISAEFSGNTKPEYLITQAAIDAMNVLTAKGVLIAAAMGNNDWDLDSQIDTIFSSEDKAYYPAAMDSDHIITIVGTNVDEQFGGRSSWGRFTADVGAPGQEVLTTSSTYYYDYFAGPDENGEIPIVEPSEAELYVESTGSSPATAFVSGMIALLNANTNTANLSPDQVRRLILSSSKPVDILKHTSSSGGLLQMDTVLNCNNQFFLRRQAPQIDSLTLGQGETFVMEVQNYNCENSNGDAYIPVTDLISNSVKFYLYDNGMGEDEVAGDGIYTGSWSVESSSTYKLSFGTDSVTNEADVVYINPQTTFIDSNLWGVLFGGSSGLWSLSNLNPLTELSPFRGSSYYFSASANAGYRFKYNAATAGSYTIYANWPLESTDTENAGTPVTLAEDVQYEVTTANGIQYISQDQSINGGTWVKLGTFDLNAGANHVRARRGANSTGVLVADTIRVIKN